MKTIWFGAALSLAMWSALASNALGQTDIGGLFEPWNKDLPHHVDSITDVALENAGHSQDTGLSLRLDSYETFGRYELTDKYTINPTVGWDTFYLDINSDNKALPKRLVDTSMAFATPLGKFGDWFAAMSVGVGYAGDAPFSEGDGYYGKSSVLVGRELDKASSLLIGLEYDGNRVLYADFPLPGFAYTRQLPHKLSITLGFPYDSVIWEPIDRMKLSFKYEFPGSLAARAQYDLTPHWQLYGTLRQIQEGFHSDMLAEDRRIFFEQQRAEAGIKWIAFDNLAFTLGGGYAFNTKFKYGWNFDNDATEIDRASDEAYVKIGMQIRL